MDVVDQDDDPLDVVDQDDDPLDVVDQDDDPLDVVVQDDDPLDVVDQDDHPPMDVVDLGVAVVSDVAPGAVVKSSTLVLQLLLCCF